MSVKKTFAVFSLALAVLLIGEVSSPAQSKAVYSAPKRLMLKGDGRERQEERVLLREKFYPIGWSKDGKFAFYLEPADEACGCYFGDLFIQDLRTDKILWEKKYTGEEGKPQTLQSYWRRNQREFSGKLAEYGITAQKSFLLRNSSFNYQKDVLTPDLKVNTKMDEEIHVTGDVVLQLVSKQKRRKTIYEKKFDPTQYEGFLGGELSGALLSPFEPRAAIVMVETYRGYEGPPHITRIRIVGADLDKSFR